MFCCSVLLPLNIILCYNKYFIPSQSSYYCRLCLYFPHYILFSLQISVRHFAKDHSHDFVLYHLSSLRSITAYTCQTLCLYSRNLTCFENESQYLEIELRLNQLTEELKSFS